MRREIVLTADKSATVFIPEWNEHYHSKHGSWQESFYVFIQNGLLRQPKEELNILEFGLGTGLNALLTHRHAPDKKINYYGIEKYPLNNAEISQLKYDELLNAQEKNIFAHIHHSLWETPCFLSPNFALTKLNHDFREISTLPLPKIDLVYFDAFGARVQPHLWVDEVFESIAAIMSSGGIFTTYSAKGSMQRCLKRLGFSVFKIPGAPGKREMIYAIKQ